MPAASSRLTRTALAVAAALLLTYAPRSTAKEPPEGLFRQMILERLQAHSRGDVAAYRALLDRDFVHVDDTGTRRTVAEVPQIALANDSRWVLGALHARMVTPSLAIVECEVTEQVAFGAKRIDMPLLETDLFVKRPEGWRFLEHAETHRVVPQRSAEVDSRSLRDFVGDYEWWPGYRETVTADGTQLYARAPNETSATPLTAATAESFFVPGDPTLGVFVRGTDGKVSGELIHFADGRVLFARKVH